MAPARASIDRFLAAHEPYPAVVVDRTWNLVAANGAVALLLEGVAPYLLEPPANALRITFHPDGMAPHIANLAEWSGHLLYRLGRRAAITGDEELARLHDELVALSRCRERAAARLERRRARSRCRCGSGTRTASCRS